MSESSVRFYDGVLSGAPRVRYESRQKALRAPKVRGFKEYPIEEQAAPEQRELPICPLSRQERLEMGVVCGEVISIDEHEHFCKLRLRLPDGKIRLSDAFCMDDMAVGDVVDVKTFRNASRHYEKTQILGRTRKEFLPERI